MLYSIYLRNGLTTACECDYMCKKLYEIRWSKKVFVDGNNKKITVFTGNTTNGILQLEVLVCVSLCPFCKMCNKKFRILPASIKLNTKNTLLGLRSK